VRLSAFDEPIQAGDLLWVIGFVHLSERPKHPVYVTGVSATVVDVPSDNYGTAICLQVEGHPNLNRLRPFLDADRPGMWWATKVRKRVRHLADVSAADDGYGDNTRHSLRVIDGGDNAA
jgi:hypothetical protein